MKSVSVYLKYSYKDEQWITLRVWVLKQSECALTMCLIHQCNALYPSHEDP